VARGVGALANCDVSQSFSTFLKYTSPALARARSLSLFMSFFFHFCT
jgi:hypothetical protein